MHWDGCIREYDVSHLSDSGTAPAECRDMISAGDPATAFIKLDQVLVDAAKAAGCNHVAGSIPSRSMGHDKPSDQECWDTRAQLDMP